MSRRARLLAVLVVSQLAGLVLVAAIVLIAEPAAPPARRLLYGVGAGVSGVLGLVAFYRGLAIGAMGVVAPLSSLAVLIPLGVGLARGEHPSTLQAAGIAVALAGVVGASIEAGAERRQVAAGAGLALVAAACFGTSLVGLNAASTDGAVWGTLALRAAGAALVFAAAALAWRRGGVPPLGGWPFMAAVGVTDSSANILYGIASNRGLLSVVAVLASLYPAIVAVLARVLLRERLHRIQLGGAATTLAGVALISAG